MGGSSAKTRTEQQQTLPAPVLRHLNSSWGLHLRTLRGGMGDWRQGTGKDGLRIQGAMEGYMATQKRIGKRTAAAPTLRGSTSSISRRQTGHGEKGPDRGLLVWTSYVLRMVLLGLSRGNCCCPRASPYFLSLIKRPHFSRLFFSHFVVASSLCIPSCQHPVFEGVPVSHLRPFPGVSGDPSVRASP